MNNIKIKIEDYFAGNYRIEYDGKYISLLGKDKTYPINSYGFCVENDGKTDYEEVVLISCVAEVRLARPEIVSVTDGFIEIALNIFDNEDRNRYYGIRKGDTVEITKLSGEKSTHEVVGYGVFDNNRVYLKNDFGEEFDWVAEWCKIITKVEDK